MVPVGTGNADVIEAGLVLTAKTVSSVKHKTDSVEYVQKAQPPAGLEPAIPCLGGRCLSH